MLEFEPSWNLQHGLDLPADVATRGKLEEVEAVHGGDLNASQVAEGLEGTLVLVDNDQRALALDVAAVAHLAAAVAELDGVLLGVRQVNNEAIRSD